jgi:hypothetical protein
MFKSETKRVKNTTKMAALAAVAGLGALAMASGASAASTFTLVSSSMDQSYTLLLTAPANGSFGAINEYVYDGPVTFTVSGYPGTTGNTTLFGFCFDLYHDMNLGPLGWTYTTNQPDGGGIVTNAPQTLTDGQKQEITNLVDTGWLMQMQGTAPDLAAQEAAIQAAIWNIEVPGSVSNFNSSLVASYFADYSVPGHYTNLATPQDKVFTISNGSNQSFLIGWPIEGGVPEPATWALMIGGFGLAGAALRRQRKAAATA